MMFDWCQRIEDHLNGVCHKIRLKPPKHDFYGDSGHPNGKLYASMVDKGCPKCAADVMEYYVDADDTYQTHITSACCGAKFRINTRIGFADHCNTDY